MTDQVCPECGNNGMVASNPILENTFECSDCMIAFNSDGEVLE